MQLYNALTQCFAKFASISDVYTAIGVCTHSTHTCATLFTQPPNEKQLRSSLCTHFNCREQTAMDGSSR